MLSAAIALATHMAVTHGAYDKPRRTFDEVAVYISFDEGQRHRIGWCNSYAKCLTAAHAAAHADFDRFFDGLHTVSTTWDCSRQRH